MSLPKYQVFISSTYEDLKEAREQIIKAVLEMGHIPVGMEMFSAADEEQWKIITRQIDQSDYYAVIVAHRYGSVIDGISYTEKEYDYAVQKGIPVIGFILESSATWRGDLIDKDKAKVQALERFRTKVKQKPIGFWSKIEELNGKFSIAFNKLINTNPRPGWIRSSDAVGPEVSTELARISRENSDLRKQLEEFRRERDTSHLAQGSDISNLSYTVGTDDYYLQETWNELFQYIGSEILQDNSDGNIYGHMARLIMDDIEKKKMPFLKGQSPRFDEAVEKMKIQFISLGLIDIQYVQRIVNHNGRFASELLVSNNSMMPVWVLTEYGKQVLSDLLAVRRKDSNSENEESKN